VAPDCPAATAHSTQLMGPPLNTLEDLHTNSNYTWGWKRHHPMEIEALYQKTYLPLLRAIYNLREPLWHDLKEPLWHRQD
jgi:hypothetical protein